MAALEKTFKCLSCGQEIKLERKPDNSGWIKYNLDGTKHMDAKKSTKPQPVTTVDNGLQLQIEALTNQVKELRETINILISQIQMLRSEVKKIES